MSMLPALAMEAMCQLLQMAHNEAVHKTLNFRIRTLCLYEPMGLHCAFNRLSKRVSKKPASVRQLFLLSHVARADMMIAGGRGVLFILVTSVPSLDRTKQSEYTSRREGCPGERMTRDMRSIREHSM